MCLEVNIDAEFFKSLTSSSGKLRPIASNIARS